MIKHTLAALALLPTLALGAAYDLRVEQREPGNTYWQAVLMTPPANGSGIMGSTGTGRVPTFFGIGTGLELINGTLTARTATWATLDGKPTTFPPAAHTHSAADVTTGVLALARLPSLPVSQVSGLQAALDGKLSAPTGTPSQYLRGDGSLGVLPSGFSGAYADLSGIPSTFAPAAHSHSAADITSGTLATARLPLLPIGQTTGLQAALDGKLGAPTGTAAQYLRGDGTLASFPTLAPVATAGTYASLTGLPTTFAPSAHTHSATDITAGTLATARLPALSIAQTTGLQTALDGKLNVPAGTTAQYLRGDGTLATLPAQRRIETFTGTTNAQGQITIAYSTPYPTVPVVQTPVVSQPNQVWWVTNNTVSGFTMTLSERRTISLLGAEVLLGAVVPVAGVTAKVLVVAD